MLAKVTFSIHYKVMENLSDILAQGISTASMMAQPMKGHFALTRQPNFHPWISYN